MDSFVRGGSAVWSNFWSKLFWSNFWSNFWSVWSATATPTVWQLGAHECESRDANVHLCAASTNSTS